MTCVTWKQVDDEHLNGFCTNRFKLMTPPRGVTLSSRCDVCTTPEPATPPDGCGTCFNLPEAGSWPLTYTIRGGQMTGVGGPKGLVTTTAEDSAWISTTTYIYVDFNWGEMTSLFNGAKLTRTEGISFSVYPQPTCSWHFHAADRYTMVRWPFVYKLAEWNPCPGILLNRPQGYTDFTKVGSYVGPQILQKTTETYARPYMQVLTGSRGQEMSTDMYTPSLSASYPSSGNYGALAGRLLSTSNSQGTSTGIPVFDTCPRYGTTIGVNLGGSFSLSLAFDERSLNPKAVTLRMQNPPPVRLLYSTHYAKASGIWFDPGGIPTPPPPFGVNNNYYVVDYMGEVSCDNKDYIKLWKPSGAYDPLNIYPPYIELIGESA